MRRERGQGLSAQSGGSGSGGQRHRVSGENQKGKFQIRKLGGTMARMPELWQATLAA
jgi:hypothetical protein